MLTGNYRTFNPVNDIGISSSEVSSTSYTLSDKSPFSVTSSNHVYTLQALKTGTYQFKIGVTWKGTGSLDHTLLHILRILFR